MSWEPLGAEEEASAKLQVSDSRVVGHTHILKIQGGLGSLHKGQCHNIMNKVIKYRLTLCKTRSAFVDLDNLSSLPGV